MTEIIKSEMNKQSTVEFIICKRLEEMSLKRCLEKKLKQKRFFFFFFAVLVRSTKL